MFPAAITHLQTAKTCLSNISPFTAIGVAFCGRIWAQDFKSISTSQAPKNEKITKFVLAVITNLSLICLLVWNQKDIQNILTTPFKHLRTLDLDAYTCYNSLPEHLQISTQIHIFLCVNTFVCLVILKMMEQKNKA